MREIIAKVLDDADNRWQHGIGSGGYDLENGGYFLMLADALLASDFLVKRP